MPLSVCPLPTTEPPALRPGCPATSLATSTHYSSTLLALGRRRGPTPLTCATIERPFGQCNNCSSDKIPRSQPLMSPRTAPLVSAPPADATQPVARQTPLLRRALKGVMALY